MQRTIAAMVLAAVLTVGGSAAFAADILTVSDTTTSPGAIATVILTLTHDNPVQGFQTAVTADNTILTLNEMTTAGLDIESLISPGTIEFFLTTIDNNIVPGTCWGAVACILDSGPPFDGQTIPTGTDQSIVAYSYSVANDPGLVGTSTVVALTNGFGPPPGINNVITVNATSVFPSLIDGIMEFVDLPSFIRGDANSDTTVNIADGIFLIQYLFNSGPTPICFGTSDITDDGLLDITDFIYGLTYQFLNGPPPPPPFPGCGIDPTSDNLDCLSYPPCA